MIAGNEGDDQFVLLDTRTPVEFEKDHLPGAVFLNYSADNFWDKVGELDHTKAYLVYCHDGGRSAKTVAFMKENGFSEAHNMKGGILAWKRAGYPVIRN
jgi:rhodanese-related sulfurtransferase